MEDIFLRTKMLIGEKAFSKLQNAKVAVFGIGGVGGYVAEALARSGVGALDLIDKDTVDVTNINRQIIALNSTVGRPKAEVMKERIADINPQANVNAFVTFYLPESSDMFEFSQYDYIADAVDNVTAKISLCQKAQSANVPIISAMGAGNKMNPCDFRVADIFKTTDCALARVMRKELRVRGVTQLKTVYSTEKATRSDFCSDITAPASIAFSPSVMGLIMASEIIKDIIKDD